MNTTRCQRWKPQDKNHKIWNYASYCGFLGNPPNFRLEMSIRYVSNLTGNWTDAYAWQIGPKGSTLGL